MPYKISRIATILFAAFLISCSSQGNLKEKDLRATTAKSIGLIKEKNYPAFRAMFAPEIAKDIPEKQMNDLVDQINAFLARKEFPDEANIVLMQNSYPYNGDTVHTSDIIYKFDNPAHSINSYSRALRFSFIKEYGSDKLAGVNLTDDNHD
jgi:hypothetical protein